MRTPASSRRAYGVKQRSHELCGWEPGLWLRHASHLYLTAPVEASLYINLVQESNKKYLWISSHICSFDSLQIRLRSFISVDILSRWYRVGWGWVGVELGCILGKTLYILNPKPFGEDIVGHGGCTSRIAKLTMCEHALHGGNRFHALGRV